MKNKREKKKSAPRNFTAVAMVKRYANTTTTMADRRKARGGAKDRRNDFLEENY